MLDFLHQNQKVCIASFEMKPRATLARMCKQAAGAPQPTNRFVDAVINHATGRLWLYDKMGQTDPAHLLAIMRYAAKKLGIQHFVVDSLMKVVKGEDDYNGQKYLVDELCAIAKDHDMHIHLIHHIKKLASEDQTPGKFDAKGSGAITDQVDNMLIHWRNKKKEGDREVGKKVSEEEPDALLICSKQRNGEWEYAAFDGAGRRRDIPLASCFGCHLQARAAQDYTFTLWDYAATLGSGP
jgi:twinkle protein